MTTHVPPPTSVVRAGVKGHADRPFRGIAMVMGSTIFLASSDAMAKYLSRDLPAIEIAWLRFTVFVLIMLPVVLVTPGAMRSTRPVFQVLRGVAMLSSSIFFILALGALPIAEATATAFVAPIFVTGLSIVFLGEKVGPRRWAATIVGLIGVLVIVRPGSAAFQTTAILPILSALGWAGALVLTRRITGHDSAVTTMAFAALVGFLILSVFVPLVWVNPGWRELGIGCAIGVSSTIGHWIVVRAFRYADASVLAPFSYSQLLWVSILGFLIFGELPDLWTLGGAAIIISSGVYTAHRERVRRAAIAMPAEPYPGA
ncbi:DMT family transporter [Tardiphaga sp. vice278]|uniref:DMT family transporter n=1 Tax=Tardiphaga sp. vice278 TaxID=2592815 RepID=UPI003F92D252